MDCFPVIRRLLYSIIGGLFVQIPKQNKNIEKKTKNTDTKHTSFFDKLLLEQTHYWLLP